MISYLGLRTNVILCILSKNCLSEFQVEYNGYDKHQIWRTHVKA